MVDHVYVYLVLQGDQHEGSIVLSAHRTREGALAAVEVILTENKKDVERLEKASEGYYRKIRPTDLLFKKVKDDDTWSHGVTYLQIQKRELSS